MCSQNCSADQNKTISWAYHAKTGKTGKSTEISKQSHVKFSLNRRKYRTVSYSFSCTSPHFIFLFIGLHMIIMIMMTTAIPNQSMNPSQRVPSQRVPSQRVSSQRVPSQRVPSQRVPFLSKRVLTLKKRIPTLNHTLKLVMMSPNGSDWKAIAIACFTNMK